MSICVNAVQVPLRTRAIEVASSDQQKDIHSLFSAFAGVGACCAYLVAFVIDPLKDSVIYFGIGMGLNGLTSAGNIFYLPEDNPNRSTEAAGNLEKEENVCCEVAQKIISSCQLWSEASLVIECTYAAHACGWAALISYFSVCTTWVGSSLYGGEVMQNPCHRSVSDSNFIRGLQMASLGQALKAGLQIPFSALLPKIMTKWGIRQTYFASYIFLFVLLVLLFNVPTVADSGGSEWPIYAVVALTGLMCVPMSTTQMAPFAVLGIILKDDPALATYVAGLNNANMLGVLVAYVGMGPIADAFGWEYVILAAALYSCLSLFFLAVLVAQVDLGLDSTATGPPPAAVAAPRQSG